jgi:hypothetical protein
MSGLLVSNPWCVALQFGAAFDQLCVLFVVWAAVCFLGFMLQPTGHSVLDAARGALVYWLLRALHFTVNIRNVCVLLAPWMASNTAIATHLLTREVKNSSAGLRCSAHRRRARSALALFVLCSLIVVWWWSIKSNRSGYISRSVAGWRDNEGVAIFALIFAFYLWVKAVKTDSMFWAAMAAPGCFYMVRHHVAHCHAGVCCFVSNEIAFRMFTHIGVCVRWLHLHHQRHSHSLVRAVALRSLLASRLVSLLEVVVTVLNWVSWICFAWQTDRACNDEHRFGTTSKRASLAPTSARRRRTRLHPNDVMSILTAVVLSAIWMNFEVCSWKESIEYAFYEWPRMARHTGGPVEFESTQTKSQVDGLTVRSFFPGI